MTTTTYTSTKIEGYRHIFVTKEVQTEVNVREVMMIISAIRLREEEEEKKGLDYFQIFEFKGNKMINRQEEPKDKREFELNYEVEEKKLWCVLGEDEKIGEYWTIMYQVNIKIKKEEGMSKRYALTKKEEKNVKCKII